MTTNDLVSLVCRFVDKSGGLVSVTEMGTALRGVAEGGDERIMQFMSGISRNPSGAKQLLGAALLGFRLAGFIYSADKSGRLVEKGPDEP